MRHCQICGRKAVLSKTGNVASHHVRGLVCKGTGHPPIEASDSHLAATEDAERRLLSSITAEIERLIQKRVNQIDPALIQRSAAVRDEANRLSRRLRRHRSWPSRFEREMATRGYGQPPPAYLVERETQSQPVTAHSPAGPEIVHQA